MSYLRSRTIRHAAVLCRADGMPRVTSGICMKNDVLVYYIPPYVSDVRAQYERFKEILFLRLLQTSPRGKEKRTCFPSSLAISRAMLKVRNAISPPPLSLSNSMQINSRRS